MNELIRWMNWSGFKFSTLKENISITWTKVSNLLKFEKLNNDIYAQWKKITFLVWLTLVSNTQSKANHCKFSSTEWFYDAKKWPLSKNVWWVQNWNQIESVYVKKWWKTKKVKKSTLKINKTDKLKLKGNELCVYNYVDYNFQEFISTELFDYLKKLSKEYSLDYRYVLAVLHQESKFKYDAKSHTWAKWLGQLTQVAIEEVNRLYQKKHRVSEVKSNDKLNIEYTVLYLALMIKRHWSIKKWIENYNWDNAYVWWVKVKKKYVRIVMKNYYRIYKKL